MNINEFESNYLNHYLALEDDFIKTIRYVSVSKDNYRTYSIEYLKQLLSIGSEIDVMKKLLAHLYAGRDVNDQDIVKTILNADNSIQKIEVLLKPNNEILKPWDYVKEPDWWTAYNEIKHNRQDSAIKMNNNEKKYYQFANLENTINALAGLLTLEFYAYRIVAINCNEKVFVPQIYSVFSVINSHWKDIPNGDGYVFLNEGIFLGKRFLF